MSCVVKMVDVFGAEALSGNPLAVVLGAEGMTTDQMQRLTRWFNLSETAFLLPPTDPAADYRVRIFTLEREMPFAGHPTLGSCHAWLATGQTPRKEGEIVQQCGAGLVSIRRVQGRLFFGAPPLIRSGVPSQAELSEALQFLGIQPDEVIDAAWIDNGPGWLGLRLASAEKVLALKPAATWPRRIDIGVVGPYAEGETAFEVRAFFSDYLGTIVEDPVTGSLNASLAQWLFERGVVEDDYVASQGSKRARKGRIYVTRDEDNRIWVGGDTHTCVEGHLAGLPDPH